MRLFCVRPIDNSHNTELSSRVFLRQLTVNTTLELMMEHTNQPAVIKGMRRLRYADIEEEVRDARQSPYRWWFEYLQLSKDYWWVCQQAGDTLDADLKSMWEDFGDVHNTNFINWWIKRGRVIFAEKVSLPKVRKIDGDKNNLSANQQNYLVVEIPLNLTERTISRQVLALLREESNRQIKRDSKADRPLAKLIGIRKSVIRDAREIWCLNQIVQNAKKPNATIGKPYDTMTTQQIGIGFRLVRSCLPKFTDGEEVERKKRNGMKVAVSRMVHRANSLIANAEIGVFPSFAPVEKRVRWTEQQQIEFDAAIERGEWQPEAMNIDNFRNRFERPK